MATAKRTRTIPSAIALACASAACAGSAADEGAAIDVDAAALARDDVQRVAVVVTSGTTKDGSPLARVTLGRSEDHWVGRVTDLPVGAPLHVHADGLDATDFPVLVADVDAVAPARSTATTAVALVLHEPRASTAFEGVATSVTADGALVLATAARGDGLGYAWRASGGELTAASAPTTTWLLPVSVADLQAEVQVHDGTGALVGGMSVKATAPGSGSAQVTASFNTWPLVTAVLASPTLIAVHRAASLSVTASDPDGDALSYRWSSSCAGTFSSTTSSAPTFTLSSWPSSGSCTFTVQVSDGRGGANVGSFVARATPPSGVTVAPQIDVSFQSATLSNGGDTFVFAVSAHDPQGGPVTFAWSADAGTLGVAATTSSSSRVLWTAPGCFGAGTTTSVQATVTSSIGIVTAQSFNVAPLPGAFCP